MPFFVKAVVFASLRNQVYCQRQFDTTELLTHSQDAFRTYRFQFRIHGWPLHSSGLPQCAMDTALFIHLQDTLLDTFEDGCLVPLAITLWTKGRYIRDLIATWVSDLPDLAVPIIVRTLDDIDCPPARELIPADQPYHHYQTKSTGVRRLDEETPPGMRSPTRDLLLSTNTTLHKLSFVKDYI